MVQSQSSQGPTASLVEAGEAYARAHREHAEAFVAYKASDPKRTDGMARAMADVKTDLVGAEVRWITAQTQAQQTLAEIHFRVLRLQIESAKSADQPDPRADQAREDPYHNGGNGPGD